VGPENRGGSRYNGKERDQEDGNYYYGARYYASYMGRMMTPDPLGGSVGDPQTLNKYAYVRNSPLNLTDPTGLTDQDDRDPSQEWDEMCADHPDFCGGRDPHKEGIQRRGSNFGAGSNVSTANGTDYSPFEYQFSGNLYGENYTRTFDSIDEYMDWRAGVAAEAGAGGEVYQAFMASCAYMSGCDPSQKYTVNSQRRGTTQNIQILGPDGKPLSLNDAQAEADAGHMGVGHGGNSSWYIGGMVDVLHVVDVQQQYGDVQVGGEAHIDPASPFGAFAPLHGVEFVLSLVVPKGGVRHFSCSASGCN
jgi:RHS repeat-associated protein